MNKSSAATALTAAEYQGAAALRPSDGAENQLSYRLDPRGYACDLRLTEPGQFMAGMRAHLRTCVPIDPADIVMPEGWALGDNGEAVKL